MDQLILLGDIHGEWRKLLAKLKTINNATIIQLGDFGMGQFSSTVETEWLGKINDVCRENNIELKVFRGNHDLPGAFEKSRYVYPNVELLADYSYLNINGKSILCVGGAISVDRSDSIEDINWWKEEEIVFRPELIKPVDILLTHSGPPWIGPYNKNGIVGHYCKFDTELWEELQEERRVVDEIIKLAQPKEFYCGHFHRSETNLTKGFKARILNIWEFLEIK